MPFGHDYTMSNKRAVKRFFSLFCILLLQTGFTEGRAGSEAVSAGSDRAWELMFRLNKFERQVSTDNGDEFNEWGGFIMAGDKLNRLWLSSKGNAQHGEVDSSEVRLFYSRTVKPSVGVIVGWKRDIKPDPERDWLNIGVLGVLPYKIGADASLFVGEAGRLAARLEVAYRYAVTDNLTLTPDLEANFYSEDDLQRGIGSGLSDLDLGLRLRYGVITGVWPYLGLTWKANFGRTADIIESRGEDARDLRWMIGVSLRY